MKGLCMIPNTLSVHRIYRAMKDVHHHVILLTDSVCVSDFDELWKAFTKAQTVIQKEEGGQVPRFYVRCMAEGEDFINGVWEDRNARSAAVLCFPCLPVFCCLR